MTDTITEPDPDVTPDVMPDDAEGEKLPEGVFSVREAEPDEEITAPQPKRRNRRSKGDPEKSDRVKETPRKQPGKYVDPMMQLYGAIALPVSMVDPTCGTAIGESAEQCAVMWDELAQTSPAVRRMLEAIMQGGAWGGVVLAHVPIMIAVMGHHMPEKLPNYLQAFKNIGEDDTERGEDAAA